MDRKEITRKLRRFELSATAESTLVLTPREVTEILNVLMDVTPEPPRVAGPNECDVCFAKGELYYNERTSLSMCARCDGANQ